jgi:isoleucyl-tRNA synthetase
MVVTDDAEAVEAVEKLEDTIMNQANVKTVHVQETMPFVTFVIKPVFAKMGPEFGQLAPKIIAKLPSERAESIISKIRKEGKFKMKIDGQEIFLKEEHITVEENVKPPYAGVAFRKGSVYINSERSEELEAEGYARELMRRVQSMRKDAGLQKTDSIILHVTTESADMLSDWTKQIGEKVGAEKIIIDNKPAGKKYSFESNEKVKNVEFNIKFDKV